MTPHLHPTDARHEVLGTTLLPPYPAAGREREPVMPADLRHRPAAPRVSNFGAKSIEACQSR